jgi:hypothetical protein
VRLLQSQWLLKLLPRRLQQNQPRPRRHRLLLQLQHRSQDPHWIGSELRVQSGNPDVSGSPVLTPPQRTEFAADRF